MDAGNDDATADAPEAPDAPRLDAARPVEVEPPCEPETEEIALANQWQAIGPYGGSIRAIAFDPHAPATVFSATFGAGVFRSDDAGMTWTPIRQGLSAANVTSLVLDPWHAGTIYAGTSGAPPGNRAHVFMTEDSGSTWSRITPDNLEWLFNQVSSLAISPGGLYAGAMAVYKLEDGLWRLISDGMMGNGFIHLALNPDDAGVVYAGTYQGGLFRTLDDGGEWERVAAETLGQTMNVKVAVDPRDPNRVLAGLGELFVSTDHGETWTELHRLTGAIETIVFDPVLADRIWVGHWNGLALSADSGVSWRLVPDFDGVAVYAVAVHPQDPNLVLVGTERRGMYRSSDGGMHFQRASQGIHNTLVSAIVTDPRVAGRVLVGTYGDGLYQTEDLGVTWHQARGLATEYVQAILADASDSNRMFVGTWDGLFVSTDGGHGWEPAGPPLDNKPVTALVSQDRTMLAGTYGHGLFAHSSGAGAWAALPSPDRYVTALVSDPAHATLMMGTLRGVFRSMDNGQGWESVSKGIRDTNIRALSYSSDEQAVYAAAGDGLYSSDDGGATWQRKSDMLGFDYFRAVSPGRPLTVASWKGIFFGEPDDYRWSTRGQEPANRRVTSLARAGGSILAGTYGGGVHVLKPRCRPLYGRVIDANGRPLQARVTAEPGGHETGTNAAGEYAFELMAPSVYQVTAQVDNRPKSPPKEADLQHAVAIRLDITVPDTGPGTSVSMVVLGGPAEGTRLYRGEVLPLIAHISTAEALPGQVEVVWTSDRDGELARTPVEGDGSSRVNAMLDALGPHVITAALPGNPGAGAQGQTRMEVAEPNCLHNIGMAWDGEHLWVGHEPAETGETGRVYELAVRNGSLSVVASFAHPTSAPDALAWDGSGIWSTGHEGPDPLRPWEAGLSHVYRHDRAAGLSVTGRYSTDTQIGCGAGLTWDGVSLWGSGGNNICRFVQTADGLQIADRHAGPDNQLRSIEWVQSYLWALDSASNRLYKLDPAAGFAVVCSCAPGVQGSYGMAWDGAGFWLDSMGQPSLRRYLPGKQCPAP